MVLSLFVVLIVAAAVVVVVYLPVIYNAYHGRPLIDWPSLVIIVLNLSSSLALAPLLAARSPQNLKFQTFGCILQVRIAVSSEF